MAAAGGMAGVPEVHSRPEQVAVDRAAADHNRLALDVGLAAAPDFPSQEGVAVDDVAAARAVGCSYGLEPAQTLVGVTQ
ncbi:hypothetical protein DE4585_02038 [Mycobacteroides salmoniphilum]|uniref:Uncharacterized protein n=1 Tax=Mycobacteroides salmoniphilum TaxID=404941 RepID=A0A4V3HYD7_9MYCO|nr:hypothetical protein DE4585_02038 [Mycobacteroides salmoniphilum]